jgi:hypothetical protein
MRLVRLLAILGRINPAIWDWIVPMGPVSALTPGATVELNPQPLPPGEAVALNPQPLPPREFRFLVASALVAQQIAQAAIAAEAAGHENAGRIVADAVDNWCGTRAPHPWPHPWPLPWSLGFEPEGHWDVAGSRVVGALALASVASRLVEGPAREALAAGAERLLDTGLEG